MKAAFDLDKHSWHPSVLPGQIVLVSTVDERAAPNVAPKSWVTMAAFAGPIVAFGCTDEHRT
ncbi:MAG: flavin reductase family protein, partial [Gaiellaceae bacterium]